MIYCEGKLRVSKYDLDMIRISGRRYRVPVKNKKRHLNRYKYSFIPISVTLLNSGR